MAQTVALQRGSTSVTANGTSYADLFTQSGGIATRVILNGISCFTQGGGTDYQLFAALLVKSAGSTTNVHTIGMKSLGAATVAQFDFSPCDGVEGNFTGYSPTSTQAFSNKGAVNGQTYSATTFGGSTYGVNSVLFSGGGANNTLGSNQLTYYAVPRDFWIGPSDVVCVKMVGGNTRTFTVAYTFTTITES